MCRTPRYLYVLPLLLVVAAVGCAHTPRISDDQETEYIRMLRQEYFKTHPDGEYNEHIKKGEVVRGMDFLEVLASWGNPDKRQKPAESVEHWVYVEIDEDSKDSVQYKFVFRKNVLCDWELDRNFAEGSGIQMFGDKKRSVLTKRDAWKEGTQSAPKKK